MVTVHLNGFKTFVVDLEGKSVTCGQLVQQIKNDEQLRFKGNSYSLQETMTGRVLPDSEIVVDDRLYNLNAWVTVQ